VKILVTGASGFLGRHVVARLLARGHAVRAMVRPAAAPPTWDRAVELFQADLRVTEGLEAAFEDVDAVVHLAYAASADGEVMLADTLRGTERLLDAMGRSGVKRLVLASSFVVYDWRRVHWTLDEESPLSKDDVYRRGSYDIAKLWQERLAARAAGQHGWQVTTLRPGFIWGAGRAAIAGMGRVAGPWHLLFGPLTRLPLTHVENCADAFAAATEHPAAAGQVFNVVDGDGVRVWRYAREYARGTGRRGIPLPIPYLVGYGVAKLAALTSRILFGKKGKLPSLLTPVRFEAQFKPLRFPNRKLRQVLGWSPPLDFRECLARTYAAEPGAPGPLASPAVN
jgi:nucleoside-diphosphate-sugar epimerase